MSRMFAAVVLLLVIVSTEEAVAGPPPLASGKMALDVVEDGLRQYRAEKDTKKRAKWLSRLGEYRDPRAAVVLGEALSEPCAEIQHAAAQGLLTYKVGHSPFAYKEWQLGNWAVRFWRENEPDLRRRAAKLPR